MIKKDKEYVTTLISHSKEIQKILNEFFIDEFAKKHNVDTKYSRLGVKQEIVYDSCYFVDKKKYALHKINDNGVDCDELDIKGLETRRSDFSKMTKDYLLDLLNILLKDGKLSIIEILNFIERVKIEIFEKIKTRSRDMGRPVSFSCPLDQYKEIPQHIHGMMMWNELEYEIFEPGTRGYLFNINGIDENIAPPEVISKYNKKFSSKKYNNIVVPSEEEKIPDYYVLDLKKMISFAWLDRVDILMAPIMKLSKSSNIFDDFD